MPQISATSLARNLSEILDGVEHRGESYTVVRHGRPVAKLEAAPRMTLRDWAEALERQEPASEEFERHVMEAQATMWPDLGKDLW